MSTLPFILGLSSAILLGADLLGEARLQKIDQKLREFAQTLRDIPNQHINVMRDTTERLSSSKWDDILIKLLFWMSAFIGFGLMAVIMLWNLAPSVSTFFIVNSKSIVSLVAAIIIGLLFANMITLLIEILGKLITGLGIGMILFLLLMGDLMLWVVIGTYSLIDSFVKQKRLKSTLLFIGFVFGIIGILLEYYIK